eukprot:6184668-Pleurochrysis_carterae.AAC.1
MCATRKRASSRRARSHHRRPRRRPGRCSFHLRSRRSPVHAQLTKLRWNPSHGQSSTPTQVKK